jgi:trk system potassium uptake protein TrkA
MDNKQYIVIGMGRFGYSVATCLSSLGKDVLAVDMDEGRISEIAPHVTHAVQADSTDEKALKALGIANFDVAIVSIGTNLQASILVTMLCKELGVKYVLAKAQSDLHAKVLYKTGADKVIFPERDMGLRVAHNLSASNVLDYMEIAGDLRIVEIKAVDAWMDKSLIELDFRVRYGVNIIAIKKITEDMNTAPIGTDVIESGDSLIVVGEKEAIEKLELASKTK